MPARVRIATALSFLLIVALGGYTVVLRGQVEELRSDLQLQEQRLDQVETSAAAVDIREQMYEQARLALSDAASAILDTANKVQSDIDDLSSRLDDVEGFGWSAVLNRDLGELDSAVDELDGCVDSIVNYLRGFGSFLFC